jgi:hypothetical protein
MIKHTRKTQHSLWQCLAAGIFLGAWGHRGAWHGPAAFNTPRDILVADSRRRFCRVYPNNHCSGAAELYDPSLGTWTATDFMNNCRAAHFATLLLNDQALVAGGVRFTRRTQTVLASAELTRRSVLA